MRAVTAAVHMGQRGRRTCCRRESELIRAGEQDAQASGTFRTQACGCERGADLCDTYQWTQRHNAAYGKSHR
ncbi:hypothetical protein F2P81_004630 [Scophthalmus maximus]|uniref:Uncharacterized protein n=1 Tax=Scophthalmus maximus TaxID=52904 RepID=A0A6A4TBC8_SCOMX|nr:hypothetical protein F2P81_004630 [Scophthalmus maximus]